MTLSLLLIYKASVLVTYHCVANDHAWWDKATLIDDYYLS